MSDPVDEGTGPLWVESHLTVRKSDGLTVTLMKPVGFDPPEVPLDTTLPDDVSLAVALGRYARSRMAPDALVLVGRDGEQGSRRLLLTAPALTGFYLVATIPHDTGNLNRDAVFRLLALGKLACAAMARVQGVLDKTPTQLPAGEA